MSRELIEEWASDIGISYAKLNSYWGGDENKRCVQLSINTIENACYLKMTFNHAKEFFKTCLDEMEKVEKEYNENPPWWEVINKSVNNGELRRAE